MKKLFCVIGILIALFSIFFLLLIADKQECVGTEYSYDYRIDDGFITTNELNEVALLYDIQIQIRKYGYTNFGHNEIDIIILNPDKNIKEGVQPSIFPKNKINYILDGFDKNAHIQYFMVQENDRSKLNVINDLLDSKNIDYDIIDSEPVVFTLAMLFSSLNAKFFILLLALIILCIVSYYAYRLKEIGILKLNGWSDFKISVKIMKEMSIRTVFSSLIIMILFSIFIAVKDKSILGTYVYMCSLLLLTALFVFLLSCIIAAAVIGKINNVAAVKNGKNNKPFFWFLIIAKLAVTLMVFISINTFSANIQNSINLIESANKLKAYNFYYIHTSTSPNEEKIELINDYLSTLPDNYVYNYENYGRDYSLREIKKGGMELNSYKEDEVSGFTYTAISISDNLISELNIEDLSGQGVDKKDKMTVFIPEHLKDETKQILLFWGISDDPNIASDGDYISFNDVNVEYIKDGQTVKNLLDPDSYMYDPIIFSYPVEKTLYKSGSINVLYNEQVVKGIEEELAKLEIDQSSVHVARHKDQMDIPVSNEMLAACENIFLLVINLLSYILAAISVVTIYFELNKKAFGVYALMGIIPFNLIAPLIVFNSVAVSVFALFINIKYLVFVILEICIYLIWAKTYINNQAVAAIKGE